MRSLLRVLARGLLWTSRKLESVSSTSADSSAVHGQKWDRDTPWRQGHIVPREANEAFNIPSDAFAVVISHDCDLAQDPVIEPVVEVILAKMADAFDGGLANSKNPRRLHVKANDCVLELVASARRCLDKERSAAGAGLADHLPSEETVLGADQLKVLRTWLSERYRRAALPDAFANRLTAGKRKSAQDGLVKILTKTNDHIQALFLSLDDPVRERSGPEDPYELRLVLVYKTADDPEVARQTTERAAQEIEKLFEEKFLVQEGGIDVWKNVELVQVEVVSDTEFTYADSMSLIKWHAEHISLRAEAKE